MTTTDYAKPLPVKDGESAPFWESLQAHAMRLQRCPAGHYRYPVNPVCPRCLATGFAWEPVSGRGTMFSFTIVHQVYDPGFKGDAPYNVAVVELEEGPRMVTNITGVANDDLRIGMPVRAVYEDVTGDFTLVKFTPV